MVTLGQPRTGRNVAAPWFLTKIPLKVAGGRTPQMQAELAMIEHDLLMKKTCSYFFVLV